MTDFGSSASVRALFQKIAQVVPGYVSSGYPLTGSLDTKAAVMAELKAIDAAMMAELKAIDAAFSKACSITTARGSAGGTGFRMREHRPYVPHKPVTSCAGCGAPVVAPGRCDYCKRPA